MLENAFILSKFHRSMRCFVVPFQRRTFASFCWLFEASSNIRRGCCCCCGCCCGDCCCCCCLRLQGRMNERASS
ncbi:unnamed protein product [Haemonchus placei]|uniref:G_PROTEIN_RECEP_F1_2 domain-containing protein n=1 Tax=Haemonchus placei TaxID=6290 RepID=A0A0N4WB17_HAEPC|nr:unnamed protein product [Haemonchus placei]